MTLPLPKVEGYQPVKLSASDYWLLADAGAFRPYVKTELIEGELFVVNTVHTRHARAHATMTVELGMAVRTSELDLEILSTPATALSADSVPEPDVVIAERTRDKALPGANVKLAVEISDSTLAFDLGRKAQLYARGGIPEYWVVDVEAQVIHQMWSPKGEEYEGQRKVKFGKPATSETLALSIDTATLF
jgi:Uma2 family endonuclease